MTPRMTELMTLPLDRIVVPDNPLPAMAPDQYAALRASIAACGLLRPLAVAPADAEGRHVLLGGHHRLMAAAELGHDAAACTIVEGVEDPGAYALEDAICGRQLTQSGRALLVLLKHPELIERNGARGNPDAANAKKGGINVPRRNIDLEKGSEEENVNESMRFLAQRYSVRLANLSDLVALRIEVDDEVWAEVCHWILDDEVSVGAAKAGVAGRKQKATRRKDPDYGRLTMPAAVTLANAFAAWNRVKWHSPANAEKSAAALRKVFELAPDKVRDMQAEVIATKWPKHEIKALVRTLNRVTKKS